MPAAKVIHSPADSTRQVATALNNHRGQPIQPRTLETDLGLSRSTIHRALRHLLAHHWVKRERHRPSGRRGRPGFAYEMTASGALRAAQLPQKEQT